MLKVGDKIEILYMEGEPQYEGKTGFVTHIDAIGQVHGTWGGLALDVNIDSYRIIKEDKK